MLFRNACHTAITSLRFFHVVHPQYCRPALQGEQSQRQAAGKALVDRRGR